MRGMRRAHARDASVLVWEPASCHAERREASPHVGRLFATLRVTRQRLCGQPLASVHVASDFLAFRQLGERRPLLHTLLHAHRTARIETAAKRALDAHLFLRWQGDAGIPLLCGIGHRDRVDQQLDVGMLGVLKTCAVRPLSATFRHT